MPVQIEVVNFLDDLRRQPHRRFIEQHQAREMAQLL